MVLVGAGGVDHGELVRAAEKSFGGLPVSPNPIPFGRKAHPKPDFVGSEVRVRDDDIPTAHIAVAVEGVSWSSPDYYPMLVMQSIFGNWDRALGSASLLSSRLSDIIAKHNLANSYMSFSTSYSDTGLWGIYLVSENLANLDDLLHFTLREWTRMSIAPTTAEVERAKSQLKASLLLGLDGTTAIAEDIGRQLVTSGHRMTPKQIENAIDAVTPEEVKRVAQKYLWDKDVRHLFDFFSPHVGADWSLNDRLPSQRSVRLRACSTITASVRTCHPCSTKPTIGASPTFSHPTHRNETPFPCLASGLTQRAHGSLFTRRGQNEIEQSLGASIHVCFISCGFVRV
jgi:predicted Zn-dependent peptidase